MSLEDKIVTVEELVHIQQVIGSNKPKKGSVVQIFGDYYYVKSANEKGAKLGSQIRIDADVGYNFRTNEDGMYMNVDEFLGLVKMHRAGKLLDLVVTKKEKELYVVFDKSTAYHLKINNEKKRLDVENVTKTLPLAELNKILN